MKRPLFGAVLALSLTLPATPAAQPSRGTDDPVATLGAVAVNDSEIDVSLRLFSSDRRLP